jgi:TRAP transporter 4TM/12TM fusion protein
VAGCGGQVMPPVMGVAAFVMITVLGISYWRLCIAAILPAILYYTALYVQVDAEAALTHLEGLPREKLPSLRRVLMKDGYLLIPLLVLIYFLGGRAYAPAVACLYAAVSLLVVSAFKKETRLNSKSFVKAIEDSGWFLLQIGFAMALASILASSIIITGLGPNISIFLRDMAGGNLALLLLMAGVACYFFGTGLDTVSAYLLVALLVAPAIVQAGVPPLSAHFFVLYLAFIGHITPPAAPPVFVAAGIAGAPFFRTGWLSMRLGLGLLAVPFFAIYRPGLLIIGNPGEILYATVVSFAGIILISGGVGGYLLGPRNVVERIGLIVAGLLLVWPPFIADLLGAAMGITILVPWTKARALVARLLGQSAKQAPEEIQRGPRVPK